MNKIILSLGVALLMFSTSCEEEPKEIFDSSISIMYMDADGNDLLNPNKLEGYKEANINIYYMIGAVKTQVIDSTKKEHPENFSIEYSELHERYYLDLLANHEYATNSISTTLIDFGSSIDTLIVKFNIFGNNYNIGKAWYNGDSLDLTDIPTIRVLSTK